MDRNEIRPVRDPYRYAAADIAAVAETDRTAGRAVEIVRPGRSRNAPRYDPYRSIRDRIDGSANFDQYRIGR